MIICSENASPSLFPTTHKAINTGFTKWDQTWNVPNFGEKFPKFQTCPWFAIDQLKPLTYPDVPALWQQSDSSGVILYLEVVFRTTSKFDLPWYSLTNYVTLQHK